MKHSRLAIRSQVPLHDYTTLELGGPAAHFLEAPQESQIHAALAWARERELPLTPIGGGSNIVVSDQGVPGLVLRVATRGIRREPAAGGEIWHIAAGENWDQVVAAAVAADLAGIECLSGIPGNCGAAPIQNIGAYGQEIAETLVEVQALEVATGKARSLRPGDLDLAYRNSRLKREANQWIVTGVTLLLQRGAPPALRYPGLEDAVRSCGPVSIASCREAVLELRRSKSMVQDPADPNRRSAGSFFLNPILPEAEVRALEQAARDQGLLRSNSAIPSFPAQPGCRKIPAAWLIEQSGFPRGLREGGIGLSSCHTLALVHHGGATTQDLLQFAAKIRQGVSDRFGVQLEQEPILLGFAKQSPG